MKLEFRFPAAGFWLLAVLLGAPALRAEVRYLMLGIDVNCPPGLGECWKQGIAEGVARMREVALINDEADGESQTAEVRTRGDRLIPHDALARHLESIQMGARLRSVEAVVDGWLEQRNGHAVLRLPETEEILRLGPLTAKVQWDRRRESSFPVTPAEHQAYALLLKDWQGERQPVRITGPVRAATGSAPVTLEVREWHRFGTGTPSIETLALGIRVNSPYGLGDPWVEARESLERSGFFSRVADAPESDGSTAVVWLRDGRLPDLRALGEHLGRAGIGAELLGVETLVEGRLGEERGQLVLKLAGGRGTLCLAPLTRKAQWDHRLQREAAPTPVERGGYARLLSESRGRALDARISGPLVAMPGGGGFVLEVRGFDLNPGFAGTLRDTMPPAPMRSLRALARDGGGVFLDWGNSREPDFAGYNVYRRTEPNGQFRKVNRSPVVQSELVVKGAKLTDQFVVKVVDRAGNESAPSPVADARPPAVPANLTATAGESVVLLRWDGVDDLDLDSYSIYRSESPAGPFAEVYVGVLQGYYADTGVENNVTYHYVVTAVDGSDNVSAFSNSASTTPAATKPKVPAPGPSSL